MSSFRCSLKAILDFNLRYTDMYSGENTQTTTMMCSRSFLLRNKGISDLDMDWKLKRSGLQILEKCPGTEFYIPAAPAFRTADKETVAKIVDRLNRPKSEIELSPLRRKRREISLSRETESTKRSMKSKPQKHVSEKEGMSVYERLHAHQTHTSRVRSARGQRVLLPRRNRAVQSAPSCREHDRKYYVWE